MLELDTRSEITVIQQDYLEQLKAEDVKKVSCQWITAAHYCEVLRNIIKAIQNKRRGS